MRKVTNTICRAFEMGIKKSIGNTMTDGNAIYLHGNKIAEHNSLYRDDGNKSINITLAGWNTNTTRERLNGLLGVHVTTKQGQAYLNGKAWDGEWVTIER